MCSYRCESPLSSGGSVNEPLRTASSAVTSGTLESGSTMISIPFASVFVTIGTLGSRRGAATGYAATAAGFVAWPKAALVHRKVTKRATIYDLFTLNKLRSGPLDTIVVVKGG